MSIVDHLQLGFGRRLPMILQAEAAECGIACLVMVSSYFGRREELSSMRQAGYSLRGVTLGELMELGAQFELVSRPLRLELDELTELQTPCILHWNLNHFVVLKKATKKGIVIHDPASGIRHLKMSEVSKSFTGVAVEMTPTADFKKQSFAPRIKVTSVLGRLVGIRSAAAKLLSLALAMEVVKIVTPFFVQLVVDEAIVNSSRDLLTTLVIGFALLAIVQTALSLMQDVMLMGLGASLTVQSRAGLFTHMLRLPASYFESRHMGDIMSRFESQDEILNTITTELLEAILDGLMVGLTLLIMYLYSPKLTLVVVITATLYGLLRWALYRPQREASAEEIVWRARMDSHLLETMRGIKTIKLFNAINARQSHWFSLLVNATNRSVAVQRLSVVSETFNVLLLGLSKILVVWLGALAVMASTLSVGMLLAFVAYMDQFLQRVSQLIDRFVQLRMLRVHAERLGDIALTPPEPLDVISRQVDVPSRNVSVEARGLSFRYSEADPYIVEDVNFTIRPGESVAITGTSGSGKSTLLKILASLLEPTDGEILIDGRPLSSLGLTNYREIVGIVMQDDRLFAGSIEDNISFFSQKLDRKWVEHCAWMVGIHDEIEDMAMGYQTLIGDMGTILSGGQQQRLLLARALYRDPKLLLLDEATSFLDVGKEAEVNAAIASLDITRIMVAHRPETIRSADRVIELGNSRIMKDLEVLERRTD